MALTIKDEVRHLTERHPRLTIRYKCEKCDKAYESYHAASCHIPKCPAARNVEPQVEAQGQFGCEDCDKTFLTARGRSQHQRTAHPEARNLQRAVQAARPEKQPKPGKAFTVDEIECMLRLEKELKGERNMAKAMLPSLPHKTLKQVRDKRNEENYKRWRDERLQELESSSSDEDEYVLADGGATPEIEEELPTVLTEAVMETVEEEHVDTSTWRCQAATNILDTLQFGELPQDAERVIKSIQELIANKVDGQAITQAELDAAYQAAIEFLLSAPPDQRDSTGRARRNRRRGLTGRSEKKARVYARTQDLFRNSPGTLGKMVRDNMEIMPAGNRENVVPSDDSFKQLYDQLWGNAGKCDIQEDEIVLTTPLNPMDILYPISPVEITRRFRSTRSKVAAGSDGLRKKDLQRRGGGEVTLAVLNLILLALEQPSAWRINRTTLLLKEGKDPSAATNYRPITISSILSRLYWGIIDRRLRASISLNARQKGFVHEMGCYNNVHILNEILATAKRDHGIVVTQVDISKAFDTLPHLAIETALKSKGMPYEVVKMITNSYKGAMTRLKCANEIEVNIMRGVKQGDPLSPLIFNVCMDHIIEKLESMGGYAITPEQSISCLAFADDMILLAKDVVTANAMFAELESFLYFKGMALSIDKCAAFEIKTTKDNWYVVNPRLQSRNGDDIGYLGPNDPMTYLGMQITPWSGVVTRHSVDKLRLALVNINRLALKPHQKVELLARYVLPHFIYAFTVGTIGPTEIKSVDQALRKAVKQYLHLPLSTADGLIYTAKRDGGLGFPKLGIVITSSSLKAGWRFLHSDDPAIRAICLGSGLEKRMKRLAHVAKLGWPIQSTKEVDSFKHKAKENERKQWAALPSQGKAVNAFKGDKAGNEWLYRPTLLRPSRFITALKMRTNVAANKVSLNRATKTGSILCRHCKALPETLGHILGQCTYTKSLRIKRHNDIRDFIEKKSLEQRGMEVTTEARVADSRLQNLQPDLIIKNRGRVFVTDVTVCHEDGEFLERGAGAKLRKYEPLKAPLKAVLGAEDVKILPIVVGTRGALPQQTLTCLNELGLRDRGSLRTISLMALRSSIELYHIFMDYNAPLRNIGDESVQQ